MKIISIFKKNLLTISRNWSYFLVLFICPLILILISGAMLQSNNLANIKIGVVSEDPEFYIGIGNNPGFQSDEISNKIGKTSAINEIKETLRINENYQSYQRNIISYANLGDCIFDLTNSKNSVCINVKGKEGPHQVDVYLDNTRRLMSFYAKQFVLQKILDTQSGAIEQTSDTFNQKLIVFSTSLENAKKELVDVKKELDEQESMLLDYKFKLDEAKRNFDYAYPKLKALEPTIKSMKSSGSNDINALKNNINEIRNQKNEILNNINYLKNFLSLKLAGNDYNSALNYINSITYYLNSMDTSLSKIENNAYLTKTAEIVNNLDMAINYLDEIKQTLDNLEKELDKSIEKIRSTREKISLFMIQLENSNSELKQFSEQIGSSKVSVSFHDAFSISSNPVFLAFPLLITIIISFTAIVLSNMFVLKQINQASYFRDIMTPTKDIYFLLSDYLVNLFFVIIEVFVLSLIGIYWVGISASMILTFILPIFLAASVFILIGMSLGYLLKSQNMSMLISIFLVMLMFLFSDVLAPSELSGEAIQFFMSINPFVILNNALTDILLLNHSLVAGDVSESVVKLFMLLVSLFFIAYLAKKISKENALK